MRSRLLTPEQHAVSAELYYPRTGTWTTVGRMSAGRVGHMATLLLDGRVLVAEGRPDANGTAPLASAELYTPFTLGVRPTTAAVGQPIAVTGTYLRPGEMARLFWDRFHSPELATVRVPQTGEVVARVQVPSAPYGQHTLIAIGQTSGLSATAVMLVQPRLRLVPAAAHPGTAIVVAGSGFGRREDIVLHWDSPSGPHLGETTSTVHGSFVRLVVKVPLHARGRHQVYAIGRSSHAHAVAAFVARLPKG